MQRIVPFGVFRFCLFCSIILERPFPPQSRGGVAAGLQGSQAMLGPSTVARSLRLPSRCRLSEEGVEPCDLSLFLLGEKGMLHPLCFRVKRFVVCGFL